MANPPFNHAGRHQETQQRIAGWQLPAGLPATRARLPAALHVNPPRRDPSRNATQIAILYARADWPFAFFGSGQPYGRKLYSPAPQAIRTSYYYAKNNFNLGYLGVVSINITVVVAGVSPSAAFLATPDFLSTSDFLGSASSANIDAHAEVQFSTDGVTFGPWVKYVPGQQNIWAYNKRVSMRSLDGVTQVALLEFADETSVPSRIDHYMGLSVGTGGYAITYTPDGAAAASPFNGGPNQADLPLINVTWSPYTNGDYPQLSSPSLSGVTVSIYNAGSPVARTGVNVTVEGY